MRAPIKKAKRGQTGAAQIVEFGAAFYLLLVCLLIPLCGAAALAFSAAVGQFATDRAVEGASESNAYDAALTKATECVVALTHTGIGRLAGLKPNSGYESSGVNLFVEITDKRSQAKQYFGPNVPLKAAPQPEKMTYSYRVVCSFDAGPLLETRLGILSEIPYVSKAVRLEFAAERAVEHLGSLNTTLAGTNEDK